MLSRTARRLPLLLPLVSSPLFSRQHEVLLRVLVPWLSGRMLFSTTRLALAVSPAKATLSDGLFPSGFLLRRRRPLPPPLSDLTLSHRSDLIGISEGDGGGKGLVYLWV